ncbi:nucleoside-diphosphate kinase [Candidatus Uhrbacteria bacterium]|jgi:nucleoside-diphosphate kinase|nr:nucleoside-diphosphate kinase [Candidatus Uhrbacteria bacterium]
MPDIQRTLVLLKPDAVQRELVGDVLHRFERKGLKFIAMKLIHLDETTLAEHYSHHTEKPFYKGLVEFMMQTPVVAIVFEGIDVVAEMRKILGSTNPREADAGTVRADFSMDLAGNIAHASDTAENAQIEIDRFFKADELFDYKKLTDQYHFGE